MDRCGICLKPAVQLFETGKDSVFACYKCQPLVPEITIEDTADHTVDDVMQTVVIVTEGTEDQAAENEVNELGLYCGICQKGFTKSLQLQNHMRNHRAERRFVCTYCNKAFSQSNNLRAHLRIHTNERPYKCEECGKAFTQVTNLNNHVRLHTGERPFVCPEPGCNKAYAQVTNLNQHRKRHLTGRSVENSYDCNVCGEQFAQRNHMYSHRREAHFELIRTPRTPGSSTSTGSAGSSGSAGSGGSRKLVCQLCELVFPNERLLQLHVAQHVVGAVRGNAEEHSDSGSVSGSETIEGGSGTSGTEASEQGTYACVFSSCNARLSSPREHTDHLLRAHQLRLLSANVEPSPKRGRPPKATEEKKLPPWLKTELKPIEEKRKVPRDPLEIKKGFKAIKIVNADDFQFASKLKVQRLF